MVLQQKCGAGTNVQNKIIALHHLDCPWRPADLIQRNGRGIRQGNENEEIDIFTYVTEGTFDAYLYQLVENKQKFISQIMTSKAIVRSAEDIDEKALSYAEVKALAAGNPLIIKKTELDTEVSKLKLLKQSYMNQIYNLEDQLVKYYPIEIKRLENKISNIEKDIKFVEENTFINNEENFSIMILNEKKYVTKESAGKEILEICKNKEDTKTEEIGEYRGLKMSLSIDGFEKSFILELQGSHIYKLELGTDIYGNITRIDNAIGNINKELENAKLQLEEINKQFENAKETVKIPFNKEKELEEKTKELDEINIKLNLDKKENEILDDEITEKTRVNKVKDCQVYNKESLR